MNITDNFSLCKTRNRHVTRKICFGRVKRIGDWFISTLTKTFYIKLTLLFGSNYKWIAIFGDCGCHTLMLKLWKDTFLACNETRFWYWNKHDVLYIKEYTHIEENYVSLRTHVFRSLGPNRDLKNHTNCFISDNMHIRLIKLLS